MGEWKSIPGAPLYEASKSGQIRSWKHRNGAKGRAKAPHVLKQSGKPCLKVSIYTDRKRKIDVHVLIAKAFLGDQPEGYIVCHENGKSTDNRLENLRFDTQSNNLKDCFAHNTERFRGERNAQSKLTVRDVLEIRKKLRMRDKRRRPSKASLAREYGVSTTTIWQLSSGKSWRHVK